MSPCCTPTEGDGIRNAWTTTWMPKQMFALWSVLFQVWSICHLCKRITLANLTSACRRFANIHVTHKRHLSRDNPEPQLIAETIDAFYENNTNLRAARLSPLQSKTLAGIIYYGWNRTDILQDTHNRGTLRLHNILPKSPLSKNSLLPFHCLRRWPMMA